LTSNGLVFAWLSGLLMSPTKTSPSILVDTYRAQIVTQITGRDAVLVKIKASLGPAERQSPRHLCRPSSDTASVHRESRHPGHGPEAAASLRECSRETDKRKRDAHSRSFNAFPHPSTALQRRAPLQAIKSAALLTLLIRQAAKQFD
jgi:hypothetical protein